MTNLFCRKQWPNLCGACDPEDARCPLCETVWPNYDALYNHLMKHCGVTAWIGITHHCCFCDQPFNSVCDLLAHIKAFTPDELLAHVTPKATKYVMDKLDGQNRGYDFSASTIAATVPWWCYPTSHNLLPQGTTR